ncbi:MAG: lipopolysaccharide biosynthesis protein [Chloroflexus sp.]
METEIDLKPYVRKLLRRWWVIVTAGVVLALIAVVVAILRSPPYIASASLLIVPATVQLSLDSRFTTRDSFLFTTTNNQREALLSLASDRTLEKRVAEVLGKAYTPNLLLGRITITVDGDLVRITARAETDLEAEQLATVWAQEYAGLVLETYNRTVSSRELVEQQLAEAQQRYRLAQAELEAFIAKGELTRVEQEVRRLTDLIGSAQSAGTDRFRDYLLRSNAIEQLLRDARLLRDRLESQPLNNVNQADAIAALLLRIRNLSDRGTDRPILQLDSSLSNSTSVTIAELNQLINVLEAEQRAVRVEAQKLSELPPEDLSADASLLLYQKLAAAQTKLEQLNGQQRELIRARDIAFNSIDVLLRRMEELRMAEAAPQVAVRYLGTITSPTSAVGRQTIVQAATAALVGMVLMSVIIVILEAIAIARRNTTPQPKPTGD